MEKALSMERDVYYGHLKLDGVEHPHTLSAANNYSASLLYLDRFREAESVLRKSILAAQRVLGKTHMLTLQIRTNYARVLYYKADDATLDDLREAVTTLEDLERVTRRVLGGEQPLTVEVRKSLQNARTALCAREVRNLIL